MDKQQLPWLLKLQQIPGFGHVTVRNLIAYCGSPEAVFRTKTEHLRNIPGVRMAAIRKIRSCKDFSDTHQLVEKLEKQKIRAISYYEQDYPKKLKEIKDAPLVLYYKGNISPEQQRVIAVVGTRKPSAHGIKFCKKIVEALAAYNVVILSGLAYGIDVISHKAALANGMNTIGVLAHGLDTIYPFVHRNTAIEMTRNGGLITEYPPGIKPERENFPERNRIIAGMADAVLVVETGLKGGATITAEIAHSYNRDVFALPGNVDVETAKGCNKLIKSHKACLIEHAGDIAYQLGWDLLQSRKAIPDKVAGLDKNEKQIFSLLKEFKRLDADTLSDKTGSSTAEIAALMLNLEFKGVVQSLPGNVYVLV